MPVSFVRKDYLFSEAFELVGRRLFGDDWQGNELAVKHAPSPDDLAQARAPYVEELRRIEAELAEIRDRIGRTLDEREMQELRQRNDAAFEQRNRVAQALLARPEPGDVHVWQYERYQRRLTAEATLVEALKQRKIKAHTGSNHLFDDSLWHGHPHFGYSIELSVVRMPRTVSSKRFQPIRIEESTFDIWLATLTPLTASAEKLLDPAEACRLFLARQIAAGAQSKTKEEYLREAQAEIPRLSERTFESVWKACVPPDWKQAGRRRWSK